MSRTIGLVHAKWCGHCTALKPEWDKMKLEVKGNPEIREIEHGDENRDSEINKINEQITGDKKVEIQGYPTIFKIDKGELQEYQGERNAKELIKWANDGLQKGGKTKTKRRKRNQRKSRKNKKSTKK
jgi:thiol-disulfide isomerase/thioredoxin